MRRLLLVMALCASSWAQLTLLGVGSPSGAAPPVNVIGPLDYYIDLAGTTAGTTLTAAIMNAGTIGNANTGQWAITGSGMTAQAHQAGCGAMLGTVSVDGTVYPGSHTALSFAVDNVGSLRYFTEATPSIGYRVATVSGCFIPGPPSVAQGSDVLFDSWSFIGSGKYVIMQLRNGNCGGSAQYGVTLHTNPGGVTTQTGCIVMTQGAAYWCSLHADYNGGTSSMSCYNPSTGVQVGSTITASQDTGADIDGFRQGNAEAGTASGTTTYFENTIVQWSGSPPVILGPSNSTRDPVYWVAKSHNNKTTAGTTVATTKALDVPANSCQVVTCSNENASGQTTGVANTAGDTFTAAAAVKSAANAQSISQWVSCGNSAHTAQLYTCTFPSSSFSNIDAELLLGATAYDTGNVGNTASGANITSGTFTPNTATGTNIYCAYIQAGVAITPGTNYTQLNTSSTNSMGCGIRTNAPNSSQTATGIHSNTSASMIVVGNYKQ